MDGNVVSTDTLLGGNWHGATRELEPEEIALFEVFRE